MGTKCSILETVGKIVTLSGNKDDAFGDDPAQMAKAHVIIENCLTGNVSSFDGPLTTIQERENAVCRSRPIGKHTVDAQMLKAILTALDPARYPCNFGVRIKNAVIADALDLDSLNVLIPLAFEQCSFTKPPKLTDAETRFLSFTACHVPGLKGSRLNVRGALVMRRCRSIGEVRLSGATIAGNLDFRGSTLDSMSEQTNESGKITYALHVGGAQVGGHLVLCDKFCAEGIVRLSGAKVGRNLDLTGGTINSPHCWRLSNAGAGDDAPTPETKEDLQAIMATALTVNGDLQCGSGFTCNGEFELLTATVEGDFECYGANFLAPYYNALSADGCKIGGAIFFDKDTNGHDCRIDGIAGFNQATVGDGVYIDGLTFDDSEPPGFASWPTQLKYLIVKEFTAWGKDETVVAAFNGFDLSYVTIHGKFKWAGVTVNPSTRLRLYYSTVDLMDSDVMKRDLQSWPYPGNLNLEGFEYGSIDRLAEARNHPVTCHNRKKPASREDWTSNNSKMVTEFRRDSGAPWNKKKPALEAWLELHLPMDHKPDLFPTHEGNPPEFVRNTFTPQPYEQMAKLLRAHGHARRLADVVIERERHRRKSLGCEDSPLWLLRRFINSLSSVLTGHGHRPWRILWGWLPTLFVTAWLSVTANVWGHAVPIKGIDRDRVGFNALVYAIDTVVPIIDFQQAKYWTISANCFYNAMGKIDCIGNSVVNQRIVPEKRRRELCRSLQHGWFTQAWMFASCRKGAPLSIHSGDANLIVRWIWIANVLGWLFATLFVASFTPLIRKE